MYEINKDGTVRNVKSKKVLKPNLDRYGYYKLTFNQKSFGHIKKFVHQLVMEVFVLVKPDWATSIDHIDRNKLNNNISNLRWANPKIQADNKDYTYLSKKDRTQSVKEMIETRYIYRYVMDNEKEFQTSLEAAEFIKLENPNLKGKLKTIQHNICDKKYAYGHTWKKIKM